MLFHSLDFVFLLILTILFYYLFKNKRLYVLGISNLIFYGVSGLEYLMLFLSVSFISYQLSRLFSKEKGKKIFLFLSIGVNLINLLFFKYFGFLIATITKISHIQLYSLNGFASNIILPIGISFYTFQIIAYLVDVYQDDIEPPSNFLEFWVFISFFGQLIAGPIMRGREFLFQIKTLANRNTTRIDIESGIFLISLGLFKKVVIADPVASYVNQLFSNYQNLNFYSAWIGIMLFAFQIYLDFSSYSEIAVGTGKLLGLDLRLNFITPYLSKSPAEFWKRWHITLSEWIRDYIYIPLGGNEGSNLRVQFNLLIAMAISGLWHGANYTFIIWGIYNGFLIVLYKFIGKYVKRLHSYLQIFIMFILVNIGWVFFRVDTLYNVRTVLSKMIHFYEIPTFHDLFGIAIILLLFSVHVLEYSIRRNLESTLQQWESKFPSVARAFIYVFLITIFIISLKGEASSFIYFQF